MDRAYQNVSSNCRSFQANETSHAMPVLLPIIVGLVIFDVALYLQVGQSDFESRTSKISSDIKAGGEGSYNTGTTQQNRFFGCKLCCI